MSNSTATMIGNSTFPVYPPGSNNIFGYVPSETGAIIAGVLFGILFIIVLAITIRKKSWFLIVVPIASMMEVIGFALRPGSANTYVNTYAHLCYVAL